MMIYIIDKRIVYSIFYQVKFKLKIVKKKFDWLKIYSIIQILLNFNFQVINHRIIGQIIQDQKFLKTQKYTQIVQFKFYTVIGYGCLDVVFRINLHFITQQNDLNAVVDLGLEFTIVNVLLISKNLCFGSQSLTSSKLVYFDSIYPYQVLELLVNHIVLFILITPLVAKKINEEDRDTTSDETQNYLFTLLPLTLLTILSNKLTISNQFIDPCFLYFYLTRYNCSSYFMVFFGYRRVLKGQYWLLFAHKFLIACFVQWQQLQLNKKITFFSDYKLKFTMRINEMNLFSNFFEKINNNQLAFNTSNFCYKFPISISLALMTFIGKLVMKWVPRKSKRAKRYSWLRVLLFIGFTVILLKCFYIFKQTCAEFYSTGRQEITDLLLEVYPIYVFGFFVIDGLQGTLKGILKGIERKEFLTFSTLLVFQQIEIPLVVYFAYYFGLGQKVLWDMV